MRWQHETNYHNSRSYDEDEPRGVIVSQARLTVAWLFQEAQRKLDRLLKPLRGPRSETVLLKPGDAHGFTVLGNAIARHAVHESAITCPFPELDEAASRRRMQQRASARLLQQQAANDHFSAHSNDR